LKACASEEVERYLEALNNYTYALNRLKKTDSALLRRKKELIDSLFLRGIKIVGPMSSVLCGPYVATVTVTLQGYDVHVQKVEEISECLKRKKRKRRKKPGRRG